MTEIEMDHLKTWIGRTESRCDIITPSLIEKYRATFSEHLWSTGDAAPLGLHWCLAADAVAVNALGKDGHPERGGFLPPVPLPSRMWVGGELQFHGDLMVGDTVNRDSRISSITLKSGKSGPLVFVAVVHKFSVDGRLAITERQDLVYKNLDSKKLELKPIDNEHQTDDGIVMIDEVTMFRYSALTFNGHRIHYDRNYSMHEEGYPGLVVHGPLQATLLMNRAAQQCNGVPARFSYRGISPLFDQTPFKIWNANSKHGGEIWCEGLAGNTTMQSEYSKV